MLAGETYDAFDPELLAERQRVRTDLFRVEPNITVQGRAPPSTDDTNYQVAAMRSWNLPFTVITDTTLALARTFYTNHGHVPFWIVIELPSARQLSLGTSCSHFGRDTSFGSRRSSCRRGAFGSSDSRKQLLDRCQCDHPTWCHSWRWRCCGSRRCCTGIASLATSLSQESPPRLFVIFTNL
jgi:hypothetical protein